MRAIAGDEGFQLANNAISTHSSYPDLSYEETQVLNQFPPLAITLMMILRPPYPPRNQIEEVITTGNRWVGAEVFRKLIDSKFSDYELPQVQKETEGFQSTIKQEAELWVAVWEMLKEMGATYGILWDHPAVIFYKLVREHELVSPWIAPIPVQENFKGASLWHREYQPGINAKLADRSNNAENPFIQPITRELIDRTFRLVDIYTVFEKKFYRPMVSKRKSLVASLRAEAPVAYIEGKPSLKGTHKHPVEFDKNKKKAK